jgi:competence protein ComEA helix-hairpin-helix repeat region
VATWAGAKGLVTPSERWEFPHIDDRTDYSESQPEDDSPPIRRSARLLISGLIGVAVIGIALVAAGVVWDSRTETQAIPSSDTSTQEVAATRTPVLVVVHVSGAVTTPGLVQLDEGARVIEAIDAAGGATDDSAIHQLNLARPVIDGEHIVVPLVGEKVEQAGSDGPISLSRSSAERLQELPGVGPAIAERIILWREKNGPFRALEDVLAVSGIGEATLERLQGLAVP